MTVSAHSPGHDESPARDDVIALTTRLVQIASTSGTPGELEAFDFVTQWLTERGLRVDRASEAGRPAALLAMPPSAAAPAGLLPLLLFAAHVDVVPVADPAAWSHPPFSGLVRDGRLHGRGASDMKSGLAAAMLAVAAASAEGRAVALGVTTGEELGCLGAPALARLLEPHRVGAVIIPESTANEVVLGHRGATWLTVSSTGVAAHGSTPERGVNAVLAMAAALGRLDGLPLRRHPELGVESVNVGAIRGGSVPNMVPDRCEASIDLRTVAEAEPLVEWWRAVPGVDGVRVDLTLGAVWTRREHPFVTGLDAVVAPTPAAYFTDASVLAAALGPEVPIVVWGPGDPATVHTVGESVAVEAVREAERLFGDAANGWASEPDTIS